MLCSTVLSARNNHYVSDLRLFGETTLLAKIPTITLLDDKACLDYLGYNRISRRTSVCSALACKRFCRAQMGMHISGRLVYGD